MKDIIKRPIVTEKMTAEGEKLNRFGFIVDKKANKVEIKKAVEELYNVSVDKVRTMNYQGKKSTRNTTAGLIVGRKPAFKKAIISLSGDDTIDLYASI